MLKRCTKCGQEKPTSEFHANAASKDGRCNRCKACRNKTDQRRRDYPGDTIRMKTCRKCGQVKPRTAFARDADRLDHRRSYCQQCDRIYALRAAARRRAAVAAATVNAEAAPSAEP